MVSKWLRNIFLMNWTEVFLFPFFRSTFIVGEKIAQATKYLVRAIRYFRSFLENHLLVPVSLLFRAETLHDFIIEDL